MVATLGLFSSNEQAEDIATADLKYLLVSYLWGDLLSRSRTQDIQKRAELLNDASQLLRGWAADSCAPVSNCSCPAATDLTLPTSK